MTKIYNDLIGDHKEEEEFDITSTKVVASGIQNVITKLIEKDLQPKLIGKQLFDEDTEMVNKSGKVRTFRFVADLDDAADFNENDDVPEVSADPADDIYSTVDVTPGYFGARKTITGEAIDDADFNLLNQFRDLMTDSMQRKADFMAWEELLQLTKVVDEAIAGGATEFALANQNIVYVESVSMTNVTTYNIDYIQGYAKFAIDPGASTITYYYTGLTNVVTAVTDGEVSYEDMVAMKTRIETVYGTPNTAVAEPVGMGKLLIDDKFIQWASYTTPKHLYNGEIGQIAGFRMVSSNVFFVGVVVGLEKGKRMGHWVYKQKIQARMAKLDNRPDDVSLWTWEKSIPYLKRETLVSVILNGQTDAYTKV